MMSRRNTFPSLSSSRQMMMAWKVSGLSQSPAIIASRPASMRLAMAISPSRESSSTVSISHIHAHRIVGALGASLRLGLGRELRLDLDQLAFALLVVRLHARTLIFGLGFLGLDHIDTHPAEPVSYTHLRAHETVLDLVCRLLL